MWHVLALSSYPPLQVNLRRDNAEPSSSPSIGAHRPDLATLRRSIATEPWTTTARAECHRRCRFLGFARWNILRQQGDCDDGDTMSQFISTPPFISRAKQNYTLKHIWKFEFIYAYNFVLPLVSYVGYPIK
jgi:hypothetical protein